MSDQRATETLRHRGADRSPCEATLAAIYNAAGAIAVTTSPSQLLHVIGVGVDSSMVPFTR